MCPSRKYLVLAVSMSAGGLGGCDWLREAHEMFHAEPDRRAAERGTAELGTAELRVTVEPPDQLTILLDGYQVSTTSPYVGKGLRPGAHVLSVRAPGFVTFNLPLTLRDRQVLEIPIGLRTLEARPIQ
jgi:hypothetical protein